MIPSFKDKKLFSYAFAPSIIENSRFGRMMAGTSNYVIQSKNWLRVEKIARAIE